MAKPIALGEDRTRGFTLIELMIIISIIAILLAIAIPSFGRSIVATRERTLRSELATMRKAIWDYTFDKQKAPQSLDDLVTAGYLTKIPIDPITRETNWEPVEEEVLIVVDEQESGVIDVHSASENTATDGTAYNTW